MKKTDLRHNTDSDCEDDAFEVKNAMLMTALLAEEQKKQVPDVNPGETDRESLPHHEVEE